MWKAFWSPSNRCNMSRGEPGGQCCGFRNGRMFGIIKGRIKHVFYGKKRSKKRNKMKCLKCSTKRQSTATHLESHRQPRPPPAALLLYGLDAHSNFPSITQSRKR